MTQYNPFTDCTVEKNEDGTYAVSSKFWTFQTKTRLGAMRAIEIIQAAYRNGVADNQKAIKEVLGINEHEFD